MQYQTSVYAEAIFLTLTWMKSAVWRKQRDRNNNNKCTKDKSINFRDAKIISENIKIYLNFLSFFNIGIAQVVGMLPDKGKVPIIQRNNVIAADV